jgi:hypothetical protein
MAHSIIIKCFRTRQVIPVIEPSHGHGLVAFLFFVQGVGMLLPWYMYTTGATCRMSLSMWSQQIASQYYSMGDLVSLMRKTKSIARGANRCRVNDTEASAYTAGAYFSLRLQGSPYDNSYMGYITTAMLLSQGLTLVACIRFQVCSA